MIFTGTGNANKILGIPVQTGTPSDTFTLLYDAASNRWIFGPSGTPPAGGVGGGANLTTVGSVPFVTSSGVLGQDAGQLSWSSVGDRLTIGNASAADGAGILTQSAGTVRWTATPGGGGAFVINNSANTGIFFQNNTITHAILNSTGNFLLGTGTDDGTNRLQVAGNMRIAANTPKLIMRDTATGTADFEFQASGNVLNINRAGVAVLGTIDYLNGSFTWHNQTPTVGSTSLVVRAGAGQTGNLFSVRNASNVEQFWVNAFGPEANNFIAVTRFRTNSNEVGIEATSGLDLASNRLIRYSSTTDYSATKDLSLSRASANTLQVGDGGSNSNGIILSRRVQSAGETVASLPAAAAGNAGTISYVTDSNSTTIGATVAGGGANKVLVWSNGTAWRIFAN